MTLSAAAPLLDPLFDSAEAAVELENEALGYQERETAFRVLALAPFDLETGGYYVSVVRAVAARLRAVASMAVWRSDGCFADGQLTSEPELMFEIEHEGEPDERRALRLDDGLWTVERDTRTFELPVLPCHVGAEPRRHLVHLVPWDGD